MVLLEMLRLDLVALLGLLVAPGPSMDVPVSLSGSPASMARQHQVALSSGLRFVRTPAELRRAIARGELIRVRSGRDLAIKDPAEGAARAEVAHFVERLARDFRGACGERLVVTSLARPRTRQPRNAHPLSVHPAGMAMDLRIPRRAACRRWLERELLDLERRGILDATREHSPAHLHVALFPDPYLAYVARGRSIQPQVVESPVEAVAAAPAALRMPRSP